MSIYESEWDFLTANNNKRTFHQCILAQFRPRNSKNNLSHKKELTNPSKKANISRILSPIPLKPSKKVLVMLKYHKDKGKNLVKQVNTQNSWSYIQVSSANIKKIVEIKNMFSNLSTKKIKEV